MASSPFFEMDFEHDLIFTEEQMLPDCSQVGGFLPDLPPLPGSEAINSSDLVPLPDSLCEFHDISTHYGMPDTSTASVPYDPECNLHYTEASQFNQFALDDIDLDYFAWNTDGSSSPPCFNNEEPYRAVCNDGLIIADHNTTAALISAPVQFNTSADAADCGYGAADGAITNWENKGTVVPTEKRSESSSRSRLNDIGFDEMKNYFYMPITKAAKEMNVGLTVLKKRCRELGISRWPHRKMKSLKSLIHNVQELGQGSPEETIRKELLRLDEYRRMMEENPEMQLTERTKKLRQACFKANYKRRRLIQDPCCFDIHRRCYSFAN